MKKILLSTSLLVATAGVAAAEVTLSGSGRFGIVYNENAAVQPNGIAPNETTISYRLRFNVDAKFEADNGVTYGGRIRFQNTQGQTGAAFSPAYLYVKYAGLTMQVGNTDTAYDSAALMYAPELGYLGRSAGDPQGSYYSFSSGPYAAVESNRVGIFLGYSIDNLNARISYVQPNQTGVTTVGGTVLNPLVNDAREDELSISVDYNFGAITVSGAAVMDGAGVNGNDQYFIGAAYAFNDVANVGLNYIDEGDLTNGTGADEGSTVVLYGNYTFGATTVGAYVSNNDKVGNAQDTAYGIGASYDLGGASILGSIQTTYADTTTADLGVNFSF